MTLMSNNLELTMVNSILIKFCDDKGISQNFSSPYTPEQNGVAERRNKTLIEVARTMLSGSVFSKQFWNNVVATACYIQNSFLHVFGCPMFIHNRKDHLGKFDEKADDGFFLGYSLVSKEYGVFNTRRQLIEETFHITFNESTEAIRFLNPSAEDIHVAESQRYPPDEYLQPFGPSQKFQANRSLVSFIEPYVESEAPSAEANAFTEQNDHPIHTDEILDYDYAEQTYNNNHNPSTEDVPLDTLELSEEIHPGNKEKHIELVNIVGNPGTGMATRAMAKYLSDASPSECLFADFLSDIEPKKVSEAI
ncbi:retrovirus-related pol polyprotein from transposon TNT 1-94 [Tanacetum coccineum]